MKKTMTTLMTSNSETEQSAEAAQSRRRRDFGAKTRCRTASHRANRRPRILVVDDDHDTRQMYSELLRSFGYVVDSVENGHAGWNAVHIATRDALHYDLVITDDELPRMTGVELAKKLSREYVALPVIMATAAPTIDAQKLRLAALLQKPFFPGELVQAVQDALQAVGNDW
jgi:two-component system, cell cycle sensor histidine kinase and response regulator CckA